MIDPKLKDKVALITGANHGIGKATAVSLVKQGARVFLSFYIPETPYSKEGLSEAKKASIGGDVYYRAMQQEPIESTIQKIESLGGSTAAIECDLENTNNIQLLFDACESKLGPVDILINNHTHQVSETFDPMDSSGVALASAESIDRHFAVNTRASALMMTEFLQRYIRRNANWGRIINLTTTLAHAGNISYAASKRAVVSYSMSAAQEMGKYGITVNVVCPGATQTGYIQPEDEPWITKKTPLGRLGHPEDIANVVVFLASDQAGWLTGQLIYASGGFSMYLNE